MNTQKKQSIDIEQARRLWDGIKGRYPKELNVEGLEPAIVGDIAEIIQQAKREDRGEIDQLVIELHSFIGLHAEPLDKNFLPTATIAVDRYYQQKALENVISLRRDVDYWKKEAQRLKSLLITDEEHG